ncbi:ATP-binding protein [Deinococcus pimensis]|uniref:ATP-binding protein n=1 Tax=Deinococcus pimensis TaxID=309888 RepID=UPI00047F6653|nr:AAA family ATPase [Deinococcus pimensis]
MTILALRFLGPAVVTSGDHTITFPTRKTLALLAYLVEQEGPHFRERLGTLLWPDVDTTSGLTSLRKCLTYLRRAFPDGQGERLLLADRSTVAFVPPGAFTLDTQRLASSVDAAPDDVDLADARAVTGLYRGPFLDGLYLPDAPQFEAWLDVQRELYARRQRALLTRLSRRLAAVGRLQEALEVALRWLTLDDLDGGAYQQVMDLRLRLGQPDEALETYRVCERVFERELHVGPPLALRALAEQATRTLTRRVVPREVEHVPLFVGRDVELENLRQTYDDVARGGARVLLVHGESGIGKTRLVGEFVSWAQRHGAHVWTLRTRPTGGLPLQPVFDLIQAEVARDPDTSGLTCWTTGGTGDSTGPLERARRRSLMTDEFRRWGAVHLRRAPLVVVLDDAHWADVGTLELLHTCLLAWRDQRVLALVTARREDRRLWARVTDWTARLEGIPVTTTFLGPLSRDGVRGWTAALAAKDHASVTPDQVAAVLAPHDDGHPLLIVHALSTLGERGWRIDGDAALRDLLRGSARDVLQRRLDGLSEGAVSVARALSVVERLDEPALLPGLVDLPEAVVLGALDDLTNANVVIAHEDGGLRFSHDWFREAAYRNMTDLHRQVYHRRALTALTGSATPGVLAHHARLAGPACLPEAVRLGLDAGALATRQGAPREALRQLTSVERLLRTRPSTHVDEASRLRLLAEIGDAHFVLGDLEGAKRAFVRLRLMSRRTRHRDWEARAALALGRLLVTQGYPDRARVWYDLAGRRSVAGTDAVGGVETERGLADVEADLGHPREAARHAERALHLAKEAASPSLTMQVHALHAFLAWTSNRPQDARRHADAARRLAVRLHDHVTEARSTWVIGMSLAHLGQFDVAATQLRQGLARCVELGVWTQARPMANVLSAVLRAQGELGEARRVLERVSTVADKHPPNLWWGFLNLGAVCLEMGDLVSARRAFAALDDVQARYFGSSASVAVSLDEAASWRCALALEVGESEGAYRFASEARSLRPAWRAVRPWEVMTLCLRGDLRDATTCVGVTTDPERLDVEERVLLGWSRVIVHAYAGRPESAWAALLDAKARAERVGAVGWAARLLLDGVRVFEQTGDASLAARCRDEAAPLLERIVSSLDDVTWRGGYLAALKRRGVVVERFP